MNQLYKNLQLADYTVSEKLSQKIFSIPMHPYLTKTEQDLVITTINKFYE